MKSSIWSQWCFTLCCPLITLTVAFESAWEAESALLDDLFQYYNPVRLIGHTLFISISLSLCKREREGGEIN